MKRRGLVVLCRAAMLLIAGSAAGCEAASDFDGGLSQEGIAPFELTEREEYILESLGLSDTARIFSFRGPDQAASLKLHVYQLQEDGVWEEIREGGIYLDEQQRREEALAGVFAMRLNEDYSMELYLNTKGLVAYQTEAAAPREDIMVSSRTFLSDFTEIPLNEEIPVALLAYDNGTSLPSVSLQYYFEPSRLEGMTLVQAVTLEFGEEG